MRVLPKRYVQSRIPESVSYNYTFTTLPSELTINHGLDTSDIALYIIDNNGDRNYLTSFSVLSKNAIRVYGTDKIDTNIFTITLISNMKTPIKVNGDTIETE